MYYNKLCMIRKFLFNSISNCSIMHLVIGTYTTKLPWVDGHGKGIYSYEFDVQTGKVSKNSDLFEVSGDNPTYLVSHTNKLFAIHEVSSFKEKDEGGLSLISLDSNSKPERLIQQIGSGGKGPCHLIVTRNGKYIFIANYEGGTISCVEYNNDKLETIWNVPHEADLSLTNPRQDGPHCHCVRLLNNEKTLLVADLGNNKCFAYNVSDEKGNILQTPKLLNSTTLVDDAGPRHLEFHPSLPIIYVLNELNNTITGFKYNCTDDSFNFENLWSVPVLPDSFSGDSFAAAIKITSDGNSLYASNRGHNSLSIFNVDSSSGALSLQGHQSVSGKAPRDFYVHPTEPWVIVVNQDSDNGIVFKRDSSGNLTECDNFECPSPVCIIGIE